MKKIIYLIVFVIIIGLISFGFYQYFYSEAEDAEISADSPDMLNLGEGIVAEMVDSVVSTSTLAKLNMATLDREIKLSVNMLPEVFKTNDAKIKTLISDLKAKPENFSAWIDLGAYRKIIGDYAGAKEALENALIIRPNNAVALSNLGNLYGYYIKDAVKAEEYYLASIKAEPTPGFWYYQAFFFYKEVMNDAVKAKNIVAEGVKNNPYDSDLNNLLKSL